MDIIRAISRYIVRSVGLLFYFSSFPLIIYGLFTIPFGNFYLFLGISSILLGMLLETRAYGNSKKAFRRLSIITLIPLMIFVVFNIAITAGIANIIRGQIEDQIGGAPSEVRFFLGIAIENYGRIIPGLWITAVAYAIMAIILFRISSRRQSRQGRQHH